MLMLASCSSDDDTAVVPETPQTESTSENQTGPVS